MPGDAGPATTRDPRLAHQAELVDLSLTRFAELVAPAISRTFVAGMKAGGEEGRALVASYGGRDVGYLIDLRNPFAAGRRLSPTDLAAVYRYTDPEDVRDTVRRSVEAGLLDEDESGAVAASERGHAFLRDLYALHGRTLAERWRTYAAPVGRLNGLLGAGRGGGWGVLIEAEQTAGPAWAVQAPPYEPAGTPPGVLLLNRLSTLRYHRADAHAAAWQAAGLTAAEMRAMPWGTEWTPQRRAVEEDTNRRAGQPYAVLTPDERLALLADLAMLP